MIALVRHPCSDHPRRSRRVRAAVMAGMIGAALAATAAAAQESKLSPAEKAEICAEAEARTKDWVADHPVASGTVVISIWKEVFCPEVVSVKAGETLLFVNVEKRTSHSVWFKADGRAESPRFFPDETATQPVDLGEGEHDYVCGPHPWMRGRVVVNGATP